MGLKRKTEGQVSSQKEIAPGIYDLWVETDLAADAAAGQFVGVYPHNKATLLPRPISICETDKKAGRLRLVYRMAGNGTAEFATYRPGDKVSLLGVLGNGFPVAEAAGKCVYLMGGGIGIPPMVELAKAIRNRFSGAEIHIFVGYRDGRLFLQEDLQKYGILHVATEDGSVGIKGNVMDALGGEVGDTASGCQMKDGINNNIYQGKIIMACGPMPMLRAIKHYAAERNIEAYISLEERMACGVGACLGCVGKTTAIDHHSHVNNARICTDGPVFAASAVEL